MFRNLTIGLTSLTLLVSAGCAHNAFRSSGSTRSGVFYGDLGIIGSGNTVTVENGSRLLKLSLIGNSNTINVEDDVTISHIEFFGNQNTVSIPDKLVVRMTEIGKGNQVIRRPSAWEAGTTPVTPYVPPPATETASPEEEPANVTPEEPPLPSEPSKPATRPARDTE